MRALRQRNALLERAQESGIRDEKNFAYWDSLLITNGQVVASRREEFISFINQKRKALFEFQAAYDKSEISVERLAQYKQAERGAGVTLVGPHRDDFFLFVEKPKRLAQGKPSSSEPENVKYFASRGQQRLVVLELKLSQIAYIEKQTGERPVLLLDDIFSELDESYTEKVLEIVNGQQSVITTTDEEFVGDSVFNALRVIELGKNT
jgi:DNA replication and repair protein RecF